MIFVTVGTHEQSFNRLIKGMDDFTPELKENVVIQTGYSTYEPKNCYTKKFMTYTEMATFYKKARIIVTHGGPSSFMDAIKLGKVPIVVPRQKKYGEHVNNHQVDFCKQVVKKDKNIILELDVSNLLNTIRNFDELSANVCSGQSSHNLVFMKEFEKLVSQFNI